MEYSSQLSPVCGISHSIENWKQKKFPFLFLIFSSFQSILSMVVAQEFTTGGIGELRFGVSFV